MTEKLTMAQIWEELDPDERKILAEMTGLEQGILSLTKLSSALKAIIYRYHDKSSYDRQQVEIISRQYETSLQQQMAIIKQQYEHELMRRIAPSPLITTGVSSGPPLKNWHGLW